MIVTGNAPLATPQTNTCFTFTDRSLLNGNISGTDSKLIFQFIRTNFQKTVVCKSRNKKLKAQITAELVCSIRIRDNLSTSIKKQSLSLYLKNYYI